MLRIIFFVLAFTLSPSILAKCLLNLAAPTDISVLSSEIKRLKRAYRRINCEINIHPMPAGRAIRQDNLDTTIDGEVVRFTNFSHIVPDFIMVEPAIAHMKVYAYTKKNLHSPISWQVLHDYSVATVRGYVMIEQHLFNHPNNLAVTDSAQVISLLEKDRVDFAILPEPVALFTDETIHKSHPVLLSEPLYHFLHKRNQHLVAPLSKALQTELDALKAH
ncbi:hypothetical protein PULV_b0347 [Pseudoalteromonas ulvae UL12]|uniref:hypothetical protein n=1 Tax=Pseudoalteromonas ulvae TaxID=107327 RepID=UPI00186BAF35|nr:hypothetical protein [Pseudoalteromonas ulvae]MBE0365710.1 hypothetical protein [Pseudoalteromonas ulvae UL12]